MGSKAIAKGRPNHKDDVTIVYDTKEVVRHVPDAASVGRHRGCWCGVPSPLSFPGGRAVFMSVEGTNSNRSYASEKEAAAADKAKLGTSQSGQVLQVASTKNSMKKGG